MRRIPIVLPVRVSGGGVTMQTTTSRLSAEGVFIRSLVAPREGASVTLTLAFPGVARPLEFPAVVTERVPAGTPGKEGGFFAKFGELSRDAAVQIDVVLRARGESGLAPAMKPPDPSVDQTRNNKRAFARVNTKMQVRWRSSKDFLISYSENISRGGIFVATTTPPQLREIVELAIQLPDGLAPVKVQAEVVQRIDEKTAAQTGKVAGAGMQFIGGDDDFRARLDECITALAD